MAEVNDETIISVLQDKENFDTLDKSSSSSSFDALLVNSPLKTDNTNNLTLDAGSSSDEEAVKSFRRRIKRFSDSDSEVEADKENNKQTSEKTKPNITSDIEKQPRKSRLVFNDSSDDDTWRRNESAKVSVKKRKQDKITVTSDSEDDTLLRKSKVVANDSSDDDMSRKNESAKISDKKRKQDKSTVTSDSEDDIFPCNSNLVANDSSDSDLLHRDEGANISKSKSKKDITNMSSDSEDDIPRKSRLVANNSSGDDSSSKHESAKIRAKKRKQDKTNLSSDNEDNIPHISRLTTNDSSDDNTSPKNESARISDKRSKLHNKFKGLLNSRTKVPESQKSPKKTSEDECNSNSDDSSTGIESIKKKIKQKSAFLKSGICDPDTSSDEESNQKQRKKKPNQKSAIMISPKEISKPARMSAKQAMENMQKIKSESNRMLREKEVTLPYHRPKALSLKDIMNRRNPALSADGKALPVKMNSDQLKQYVKLLEQRNKEMMELCKSESEEEEETNENPNDDNIESDPQPSAQDCNSKEVTDDTVAQNDEKQEENIVPTANKTEEIDENELPELTVEVVRKKTNISNTDIPEKDEDVDMKDASDQNIAESETSTRLAAEIESQLMELRYDTEKIRNMEDMGTAQNVGNVLPSENVNITNDDNGKNTSEEASAAVSDTDKAIQENVKDNSHDDDFGDDFSDVDINMEDLDSILENANGDLNATDSPMLIRDYFNLNKKPKLTGAPGMVIDLDGSNPVGSRKLTGVELLKERFTYFAKLKTPEEKERERELTNKPGMLHSKLKHELEENISEQRSLEWAKRLEDAKQQQAEMNAIRGDDSDGDDLEKIEAKLQEEEVVKESSSETEEEEEEDCVVKDKPRKKNPMINDEAEVSDDEEIGDHDDEQAVEGEVNVNESADADDKEDEDSEESSDESSEDEQENESKPKKGRILKAFEDSDDESSTNINDKTAGDVPNTDVNDIVNTPTDSQIVKDSQDDVLPLAQTNQSLSEDLFASQASSNPSDKTKKIFDDDCADMTTQTQTFSILNTATPEQNKVENAISVPANIEVIFESQAVDGTNLDDVVAMCSGKFTQTQNVIFAESQPTQSQCPIGEDILALCTGQFYDNQFVSQIGSENGELSEEKSTVSETLPIKKPGEDKDLLDSILKEMDEPVEQPNKKTYVFDNATENEAVCFETVNNVRKKFTIDSDDESNVDAGQPARKKLKKRKREKRALQISDDEEEELLQSDEEADEHMSEVDEEDAVERVVEYDSEENEVEVKPQKQKKNRKMAEFFEQEAELTSEDEWAGSGDEDERGLDRMEREEGDDDTFHQGRLQRELGQIHMRDVLDQDKREVRLIQELLFEDGDLGDGHRQRKFRWRNLDGEEDPGAVPDLFAESQEEEFESEEQWRKQRHEREVFLRNLKEKETDEHNISIDRSTIIKANLCSKTMSSLLLEANGASATCTRVEETTVVVEEKKEEPTRNLGLTVFQQSYHGSLLSRGRGALARLAALAMPLAAEADEAKPAGPTNKRNFVFSAVTPPVKEAKKRKADNVNIGTPRLIKKFKTDDKPKFPKASLLDHLKAL